MKNVRAPRFLNDLYRDLRDRRLLLPVVALAAGLMAVPLLLSNASSSPVVPLAPAAGGARADTAVTPAVLTRDLGNTDYQRRLERIKSKNPFRQQYTLPKVTSKVTQSSLNGSALGSTSVGSSPATSTSTSSGTTTVPATPQPPSASTAPSNPAPRSKFFAFRASVAIGPAGALVRRDNVKRLTFLPYASKPMVAFLGVTEDTKTAIFLVSDDVSSVDGGRCIPGRNQCKFLELKPGDKASLTWAPQGDKVFNLKLLGISLSPLHPSHGGTGKAPTAPVLGPDG